MHRYLCVGVALGLLLCLSAPCAFAEDDVAELDGDVVVLNTTNFDAVIKASKFALVEFYAPWCSHCQHLEPHYAAAATAVKNYDPSIVIAKVDAIAESAIAQFFSVQGLPTLKWFEDGDINKAVDFGGARTTEGIVNWIKRKTMPVATTVDSIELFKTIEQEYPILIVAYFESYEGYEYETFKSVAKTIPDVTFIQTSNAEVAQAAGMDKPGISAIKTFIGEDRVSVFQGEMVSAELKAFIFAEKMPTTIEFHPETSDKIFKSAIQHQVFLWGTKAQTKVKSETYKMFREAAQAFRGRVVFVTINTEGDSHMPLTTYFSLQEATPPTVIGLYMDPTMKVKNQKYRLREQLSVESIKAFAQGMLDGTQPQEYKSAPLPAKAKENDVTVVVGKNFDDVVMDPTKDVLLQIYATQPPCKHCTELAPIYTQLAKRFRGISSVVIAKMDATENEHAKVNVEGYPSLLFFPATEDKEPVPFDNGDKERTLKTMTKFIKEQAKVPYSLPKKGGGSDEL